MDDWVKRAIAASGVIVRGAELSADPVEGSRSAGLVVPADAVPSVAALDGSLAVEVAPDDKVLLLVSALVVSVAGASARELVGT